MKQIKAYIKFYDKNSYLPFWKYGYVNVYKEYPQYGVAITKLPDCNDYVITDIQTGYGCGKSFKKLYQAKQFLDNPNDDNFKDWYEHLERIRKTDNYSILVERKNNLS